ncbi:hypothetical protein B0H14DRAFT_2555782 [Mycena olivaceomarginata]|nr:hypothetical protein B0H14DRAFT_2555782 [Mycena olivaceomarginata]
MDSSATDENELTNSQKWLQGKVDDEILSLLPFLLGISYDSGLPHLTVGLWFNLYGGRADFRRGSGIALYHFFSYDMGCRWVPATLAIWRSHVHSCPHAQKVGRADGEGVERAWSVSILRPLVLPSHKLAVETDRSRAKRRVDPDSIRVSKHALTGHSGRRNCEGWTCRSDGEYNLGVTNLASFGELACEKGEGGTSRVTRVLMVSVVVFA